MRCRAGASPSAAVLCLGVDPLFPPRGIVGSRAGASRTPYGRRCAAGLRPDPHPAARTRPGQIQ
jgi:hypothetical protein